MVDLVWGSLYDVLSRFRVEMEVQFYLRESSKTNFVSNGFIPEV